MVELTGLSLGAIVYRRTRFLEPRLLRVAILAQVADVVALSLVWVNGFNEMNPFARLAIELIGPLERVIGEQLTFTLALLVVAALKLGLVRYLVWATPRLRRYATPVLLLAICAGLFGTLSNLSALTILR